MKPPSRIVVLGPQRTAPTLLETARSLGLEHGPFATITAGWEEREGVDRELLEHLQGRARNLGLFFRRQEALRRDRELFRAVRVLHDRRRAVREMYVLRLQHAAGAARALLERRPRSSRPEVTAVEAADIDAERAEAIEALRRLDAENLERMRAVSAEFEETWHPRERGSIAARREEVLRLVDDVPCVCIAGGHVAVLLECLRLFGIAEMLAGRTVVAWSAGAMALARRVVLFHDSPPQGAGDAEAYDEGLGLHEGFVPLPHAKRRLKLEDPLRVELFARRFGPDLCMVLDQGDRADWAGGNWTVAAGSRCLTASGAVEEVSPE